MIYLRWKTIGNEVSYSTLSLSELRFETRRQLDKLTGTTLRGRLYGHITAKRTIATVVFSADVAEANQANLRLFWEANVQEYSTDNSTWHVVMVDGGDEPVEYIDDNVTLPEYNFILRHIENV
jgi:hypothetical protein